MKNLFVFTICLFFTLNSYCQITLNSITPISSSTISKFEKFEIRLNLSKNSFKNPYNPDEIDISVEFTSPTYKIYNVNAFYMEDFIRCSCPDPTIDPNDACKFINDANDPHYLIPVNDNSNWRVRFTPKESGTWKYRVKIIHNNGSQIYSRWSSNYIFSVIEANNKGFIKVSSNQKNFVYDDGSMYFPIGMNVVDFGSEIYNRLLFNSTNDWMNKISDQGGNLIRVWMSHERFGIEWNEIGLNDYSSRQNRAFDLDEIIENAKIKDVYVQLCLDANWDFNVTSNWDQGNPYKFLLSPNENQNNFFTNSSCISSYKKKVRYIIARWGYSPNILSYELFNEVDQYKNDSPNFWDNTLNVKNWHDIIITYMKSLDYNNHMFTTSVAFAGAGNELFNLNNISYSQLHHYESDFNTEFQRSYSANRDISTFNKPVILGEYGESSFGKDCWLGESNFMVSNYTQGNYFHDVTSMHNGLWSSAFGGFAGGGLYWWSDHVFNPCWGGQWKYFKPLNEFIKNENLTLKPYLTTINSCTGTGLHDNNTHSPSDINNCSPIWMYTNDISALPEPLFIPNSITTTNDDKIEVFALKSEDKILGWIHNKDNYWYNLPHEANNSNQDPACLSLNNPQPNINDITHLQNEKITFQNISCDGSYKIEFFSTYPEYDIDNDNINDNGGIIPSLTINNIPVHCGELTFQIPDMLALGVTPPLAPDYAFKATKLSDSWKHSLISNNTNYDIGGELSIGQQDIFYKGIDNRLQHYYYSTINNILGWNHEWLTDWTNNSQNVDGSIAFIGSDVFYKGIDGRLHHYYYGTSGWNHEWLTDWTNNSQNVDGEIKVASSGGFVHVFYKGIDNRLHHYYYDNAWHHIWHTDWANNLQNVGGSIGVSATGEQVFYQGIDNKLHHFTFVGNSQWLHSVHTNGINNSYNVGGSISVSANGNHVFYKGIDNRLHQYYKSGNNQWEHTWNTDWTNNSQNVNGEISVSNDGSHVFYRGDDNYIHQQYYIGNSLWGHDWVLCYNYLQNNFKANSELSSFLDKYYYRGLDNKIHVFEYNGGCNPQPLMKVNNNNIDKSNFVIKNYIENAPFPNPFVDEIELVNNGDYILVQLIDILGQVIISENISSTNTNVILNTSTIKSGIYFIRIYNNKQEYKTYKLIK